MKPLVARLRPTHDPEIGLLVDVVDGYRGGQYGFFSAHAANTFSIAIFFSLLVRSNILSLMLILWSLTNAWTRIYLGVHYPGDILCGLLWGGIVGLFIYWIYNYISIRIKETNSYVSSQYTVTGYQHSDVDIVLIVMFLSLIYCLFRGCLMLV